MSTSDGHGSTDDDDDDDGRISLRRIAGEATLFAGIVAWSLFWLMVVRLHLVKGQRFEAFATVVLTIIPIVAGYSWWMLGVAPVSRPDVGVPVSSSS